MMRRKDDTPNDESIHKNSRYCGGLPNDSSAVDGVDLWKILHRSMEVAVLVTGDSGMWITFAYCRSSVNFLYLGPILLFAVHFLRSWRSRDPGNGVAHLSDRD